MIVDTSAIMAVLLQEPDADRFVDCLFENPDRKVSAGTWIELSAVLTRQRDGGVAAAFDTLMQALRVQIVPVSIGQAEIGRTAYRTFGRGSDHPAKLNFGDCFAYALAKDTGEPLLFKGEDFSQTDIRPAL